MFVDFKKRRAITLALSFVLLLSFVLAPPIMLYGRNGPGSGPNPPPGDNDTGGGENPPERIVLDNPLGKDTTLRSFIVKALEVVRNIGFVIAVFFIVYAGFMFVTARGNDEKLKKAKMAFLGAVIGTAILLGAQIFANAIEATIKGLG